MSTQFENAFAQIKSQGEKFQISIGRPKGSKVNLFFNFNIYAYPEFFGVLEKLPYLIVDRKIDYENGTSGIAIELTKNNSLSQFIEELPELLYLFVEHTEPTATTHKGTQNEQGK